MENLCLIFLTGSNKSLALWLGVPTAVAYLVAPHLFGDAMEVHRLGMFHSFYKGEFQSYKNELYYS